MYTIRTFSPGHQLCILLLVEEVKGSSALKGSLGRGGRLTVYRKEDKLRIIVRQTLVGLSCRLLVQCL